MTEQRTPLPDGGELRERAYRTGERMTRSRFDALGRCVHHEVWHRDGSLAQESITAYDDAGAIVERIERERDAIVFELRVGIATFRVGGAPAATGPVHGDRLAGVWQLFAPDRALDITWLDHGVSGKGLALRLAEAVYRADEPRLATPPELAGVDAVAWARLGSAYDGAAEFPRLLRGLVAADPRARRYARSRISGEVQHQGTIYDVAAAALPWLVALAHRPDADRAELALLIRACGGSPPW